MTCNLLLLVPCNWRGQPTHSHSSALCKWLLCIFQLGGEIQSLLPPKSGFQNSREQLAQLAAVQEQQPCRPCRKGNPMPAVCCAGVASEPELRRWESQTSGWSALYRDCFVVVICLDFVQSRQQARRGSASPVCVCGIASVRETLLGLSQHDRNTHHFLNEKAIE